MDESVNTGSVMFGFMLNGFLNIRGSDLVCDKDGSLTINYPLILQKSLELFIEKTNAVVKFKNGNTFVAFEKLQSPKNFERSAKYACEFFRELSANMKLPEIKQACIGNYMPFMFTLWKIFTVMIGVKCSAFNRLILSTSEKPSEDYLKKIFSKTGLLKKANHWIPTESGKFKWNSDPICEDEKWIVYFTSEKIMRISTIMEIKVPKSYHVPIIHSRLDDETILTINDPATFKYVVCEYCLSMNVEADKLLTPVSNSVKYCRTICYNCAMNNPLSSRKCDCHGSQICSGVWFPDHNALKTSGKHSTESVSKKTDNIPVEDITRRKEREPPTGLQRFGICCATCGIYTHHTDGCNSLDCGGCTNQMCITCGSNVIPCGCGLTTAYRERNQNSAESLNYYKSHPITSIEGEEIRKFEPVEHITLHFPRAGERLRAHDNMLTLKDTICIARGIFAGHDYSSVTVQDAVRDLDTVDDMVVLAVACVYAKTVAINFTSDKLRAVTSGISPDTIQRQVKESWWTHYHHHFLPLPADIAPAAAAPAPVD